MEQESPACKGPIIFVAKHANDSNDSNKYKKQATTREPSFRKAKKAMKRSFTNTGKDQE